MTTLYEGMFLIDNDAVRASWKDAKAHVADLLSKHGGVLQCGRRWAERRLVYPIARKNRATFLLAYYELGAGGIASFLRELEIDETVLRHLTTKVDAIPAGERELAAAEDETEFVVPEPPADDAVDEPPAWKRDEDGDAPPSTRSAAPAEKPAEKAAEKPAEKPAEATAEATAEAPAEAPADAPAEAPAEAAPADDAAEASTETPAADDAAAKAEPALAASDADDKKEA